MKPFLFGPMTFLVPALLFVVLLRSDTGRAMQAAGVPAVAMRWNTPRMADTADASSSHRTRTGGTVASPATTTAPLPNDPFAPVYVVTSRDTYQGIRGFASKAVEHRDSTGAPVLIAESRADRLGAISRYVHVNERRCGGYFAFPSRAQAEAFVREGRAKQAMTKTLLASYTLNNQTTVNRWLPQVQEQRLYATMNHLSSYQNRYFSSPHGKTSAEWIRDHWQSLAAGRSDVTTELFTACGNCSTQPSVILTIRGWDLPDEVVVLGAHLDSINVNTYPDPNQHAPGADDDASGIATLTETLRIALADGWQPRRTVKFMGYAAEEVGLRGSHAIAQSFRRSGVNVVSVLQVDMTNYKAGAVTDMKLISDYSNTDLKNFFITLFDTYLAPMGLTRSSTACGYACSDHASWTNAGYPAAMMFEAGDPGGSFPYIHTSYDTLATMGESAQHSVKFTQFALAYLGETAKTRGKVTGGPAQELPAQ
ncbi:M20/M25/M40 family metallo-hydrolase [Pseudoxanthomonas sp. PXM02]|uniref:M20/M25/M40 family metallo-hydrolase n=1 Tax=Pseudoxanthomonas sp. PXM02 TaxID=2769294 RepID=UPI00177F4ABE|nr:M20/M25/M40 family metallo-hydrolase [Pseudoxanthomonas sp. PXM02]MBD9478855.1 M20/M25/M40 family metallo-hydrolase [Pseudoxanthomonas sp. PXM02]